MARTVVPHPEPDAGASVAVDRPLVDARLRVPAQPASLSVVRHALGGLAAALGLSASELTDLRLALTETLGAAIRRSDGAADTIEIVAHHDGRALRVTVRDRRRARSIDADLALPLIAAIADAVEITRLDEGGTAVTLTFCSGARTAVR